jgi:hypothetical protein
MAGLLEIERKIVAAIEMLTEQCDADEAAEGREE